MRIFILHDDVPEGAALDQQDTLATAYSVQRTLDSLGYDNELLPWHSDLWQDHALFKDNKNILLFNLLESIEGDCRLNYRGAQLAEKMQMAYTGGSALQLWITTDKILTKQLFHAFDLPTAPWLAWDDENVETLQQFLQQQGAVIVKPVCEDSSVGIHQHCYLRNPSDIARFLQHKEPHIKRWFAEKFIEGREFNISVLTIQGMPHILPIPELQFLSSWNQHEPKIIDYNSKWLEDSAAFIHTRRSFEHSQTDPLLQKLRHIVLESWQMMQLSGYARFDVRVDEHNNPWILEINVNPALEPAAGFAAAALEDGINYPDLISTIIDEAWNRIARNRIETTES